MAKTNFEIKKTVYLHPDFQGYTHADVAKLVDALDLGSSVARRGGSSPFIRTNKKVLKVYKANNKPE